MNFQEWKKWRDEQRNPAIQKQQQASAQADYSKQQAGGHQPTLQRDISGGFVEPQELPQAGTPPGEQATPVGGNSGQPTNESGGNPTNTIAPEINNQVTSQAATPGTSAPAGSQPGSPQAVPAPSMPQNQPPAGWQQKMEDELADAGGMSAIGRYMADDMTEDQAKAKAKADADVVRKKYEQYQTMGTAPAAQTAAVPPPQQTVGGTPAPAAGTLNIAPGVMSNRGVVDTANTGKIDWAAAGQIDAPPTTAASPALGTNDSGPAGGGGGVNPANSVGQANPSTTGQAGNATPQTAPETAETSKTEETGGGKADIKIGPPKKEKVNEGGGVTEAAKENLGG
jgi:hypothetical protein